MARSPPGGNPQWQPTTAPFDGDIEIAYIDYGGTHALVFSCGMTKASGTLVRRW